MQYFLIYCLLIHINYFFIGESFFCWADVVVVDEHIVYFGGRGCRRTQTVGLRNRVDLAELKQLQVVVAWGTVTEILQILLALAATWQCVLPNRQIRGVKSHHPPANSRLEGVGGRDRRGMENIPFRSKCKYLFKCNNFWKWVNNMQWCFLLLLLHFYIYFFPKQPFVNKEIIIAFGYASLNDSLGLALDNIWISYCKGQTETEVGSCKRWHSKWYRLQFVHLAVFHDWRREGRARASEREEEGDGRTLSNLLGLGVFRSAC